MRGITRKEVTTIGSFWVDLTRSTLYVLFPLSLVLALFLVFAARCKRSTVTLRLHLMEPLKLAGLERP